MTREIKQVDSLTDAENTKLFGWGKDIFGADDLNLRWRPKDVHFLLTLDGEVVSHVGVLKHDVSVAGQPLRVGGVGGVVTIPAAQRQGHARELMSYASEFMANWQVAAGLLFCLPKRVPYYASQGWQIVRYPVVIQQPDGNLESPLKVMVLPFVGTWPEGKIDLNSFPW